MKILLVHNKYQSTNVGGEDVIYKNELESLTKKLGKENVFSYEVSNDEINKLKLIFEIWFSFKHYNNIKRLIKDNNISIVHVHNFFPLLTPSIFKAAKDCGAKVIHTLHNYRFWCISGILYKDNYGICEKCINKKFSLSGIVNKCYRKSILQSIVAQLSFWYYGITKNFDNIDYFFVLTNFQKDKVIELGLDKNKIILKPNSLEMNFNIQENKKDYTYVGRLEESKGIYELLKVWNKLDERYLLTVVGSGDIEEKLKKQFDKNNIIFKGRCTREETLNIISLSKYLIQPSLLYETFGLTIIEAMSFGVPVIGFDIGTRKDFIKDGENGFLVQENDLFKVIKNSYDYNDYEILRKNAIKTAKLYENEYMIKKQINIYENILRNKY
jgi:glycosyltransferase involved in cell wall biosynthesis